MQQTKHEKKRRMASESGSAIPVISGVNEMRRVAREIRSNAGSLALVPTMGALHEGHLQLVREAGQRDHPIVVSIFVNPTQFGPDEDFDRYPRTLETDLQALQNVGGVDAVFAPSVADMYPEGLEALATEVAVRHLPDHLCGAFRPGHFNGVTTVVSKLFNICVPSVAFFGKKDAQQYVIIRRMVHDLDFGIEIVGVDTVREPDGLALSSRNKYLSAEEREQATVLFEAVESARRLIEKGTGRHDALVASMTEVISRAPLARLQYAEAVSSETLKPRYEFEPGQEILAAVAVYFGGTRLIDNAFVTLP